MEGMQTTGKQQPMRMGSGVQMMQAMPTNYPSSKYPQVDDKFSVLKR